MDDLLAHTKRIPHHPNTPAGHAAYASQVSAWNRQHGEYQLATELTGYPLTPGTAPICAGECYGCGQVGHSAIMNLCTKQVPGKERAWRTICGGILGPINRVPMSSVNLLLEADEVEVSPLAWVDADVSNSGEEYTEPGYNVDVTVDKSQQELIDLYSVRHESTTPHDIPFTHPIAIHGHTGRRIRLNALFDEGALVAAMCTTVFHKIKHISGHWAPSSRLLRMANGNVTPSLALWRRTLSLGNVTHEGEFEVFDSGCKGDLRD